MSLLPAGVKFAQIAHDAIEDRELSHPAFRVYAYLMRRANAEARAWPSYRTMSADLHMSLGTAQRSVRQLIDRGWLVVEAGNSKRSNRYVVYGERVPQSVTRVRRRHTGVPVEGTRGVPVEGTEEQPVEEHPSEQQPLVVETTKELAVRPRDVVWDTLEAIFGPVTTTSSRGARNRAVKELRGTDPEEISRRVQAWPHHFPDATLTDQALVKWWDTLARPPARASKKDVAEWQRQADVQEFRNHNQ